mgnify:CR=1 FL=1
MISVQVKSEEVKKPSAPDYRFKVLMIGESSSDKFGIIKAYANPTFPTDTTTIIIDFMAKNLECEGKSVRLEIWDTKGHEMLHPEKTSSTYYRGANGMCLV